MANIEITSNEKFATGTLVLFFSLPMNQENLTAASLLTQLQSNATQHYPSVYLLARHAAENYDFVFRPYVQIAGNRLLVCYLVNYLEPLLVLDPDYRLDKLLQDFADFVKKPLLTPEAFNLAKQQLLEQRKRYYSVEANRAEEAFFKKLFANQSDFAYAIFGPEQKLKSYNLAQLEDFAHQLLAAPAGCFGQAAGQNWPQKIQQAFGQLNFSANLQADIVLPTTEPFVYQNSSQEDQAQLLVGYCYGDALPFGNRRAGAEFLAAYLAGDESSLLFDRIRSKLNAAYAVDGVNYNSNCLLVFSASLAKKQVARSEQIIADTLAELQNGHVDQDVFDKTKKALVRRFWLGRDDQVSMVGESLQKACYGDQADSRTFLKNLTYLTPSDLVRFASQLELVESYCLQ
jgi:predicted Zn-dependent peptidase